MTETGDQDHTYTQSNCSLSYSEGEYPVDLDALLVSVEQKLKVPFSSLEFAKTLNANALHIPRSTKRPVQPLETAACIDALAKIIHRMTKHIQLELLLAMMEVDTSDGNTETAVRNLLIRAQQLDMDEWARVMSGTVQGLLFAAAAAGGGGGGGGGETETQTETGWGRETHILWQKATQSILDQTQKHSGELGPLLHLHHQLPTVYSLCNHSTATTALTSTQQHHFHTNSEAAVLSIDEETMEHTMATQDCYIQQQRLLDSDIVESKNKTTTHTPTQTSTIQTVATLRTNIGGMNDNMKRRGIAAAAATTGTGTTNISSKTSLLGARPQIQQKHHHHNHHNHHQFHSMPRQKQVMNAVSATSTNTQGQTLFNQDKNEDKKEEEEEVDAHQLKMNERKRKILEAATAAGLRKKI